MSTIPGVDVARTTPAATTTVVRRAAEIRPPASAFEVAPHATPSVRRPGVSGATTVAERALAMAGFSAARATTTEARAIRASHTQPAGTRAVTGTAAPDWTLAGAEMMRTLGAAASGSTHPPPTATSSARATPTRRAIRRRFDIGGTLRPGCTRGDAAMAAHRPENPIKADERDPR
jgi:hypothetical protein